MMEDNRSVDRRPLADQVRPHNGTGRPRPPGPEEQRGATATSGQQPEDQQSIRGMLRSPHFWILLIVMLAINWIMVPLFLPQPQNRVVLAYTFFKQQVASGN